MILPLNYPLGKKLHLNYKIQGFLNPSKPILILHGLLGSLDNWNIQARKLARNHTVITVDLRNHGQSPHVKGMSYTEMTQDIIILLDHLQISQCIVIGHSMGGKVAMLLALNYPQRIQKLAVVDIAPKAYPPRHQAILQGMMRLPLAEIQSRKQADNWLAEWINSPTDRGFLLKNLKRHATDNTTHSNRWYWQCNLSEIARHYLKLSAFPAPAARTYNAPCLFIKGGQSDYIQAQDTALIQQYFPNAKIESLAQAGHLPHIEDAQKFYNLVADFLRE